MIEKIVCKFEAEGRKLATFFRSLEHFTEVRFASFQSGGFITAIEVNPPERKWTKHTFVHFFETAYFQIVTGGFYRFNSLCIGAV